MQAVPEELFLRCIHELVAAEQDWILENPGSLYIRPTLIGLDTGVSYRASTAYRFFVIVSPAKNYYKRETGVAVYIEREHVRAVPGGCGEAKCGGNYAAALPALQRARAVGAEQVLWLDGLSRKYVEEVGAMNIMFVYGDKILTPALTGSILPGVTRSSLIELAKHLGYSIEETRINIEDVLRDIQNSSLTEVFGCGTAAVISPVIELIDGSQRLEINRSQIGKVSMNLKKALIDIQFGKAAALGGQLLQQRRRTPQDCVFRAAQHPPCQLLHHLGQSPLIGVVHGAALPARKPITMEPDGVDVAGAQGDALAQQGGAFVDQGQQAALHDLFVINGPLGHAEPSRFFADHVLHRGVRYRLA